MPATYSFALLLWGVLNHERGESYFFPMEPGVADWLNFVQFAVVWLGQLVLYVSGPRSLYTNEENEQTD
jgi:hypothetical protein